MDSISSAGLPIVERSELHAGPLLPGTGPITDLLHVVPSSPAGLQEPRMSTGNSWGRRRITPIKSVYLKIKFSNSFA
jgi:hypothetical protein